MGKNIMKKRLFAIIILSVYVVTMLFHVYKPLPKNISYESPVYRVSEDQVSFYYNLTGNKERKKEFTEQTFQRTLEIIDEAEQFIVLDFFLFNSYHEKKKEFPEISKKLTEALIDKKRTNPDIEIIFISDEVNTSYNSHSTPEFEKLKKNGVEVILTNVEPLRDSMPIYNAIWRMFFQWFGDEGKGWLPNGLVETAPDMTVRSYLKLFNVKANHRKTITTEKTTLISSGNPHDASAYFANTAYEVKEALVNDLLISEKAAADTRRDIAFPDPIKQKTGKGDVQVQLLTEGKIQKALRQEITEAKKGEEIWITMFYLADRDIIDSLTKAANSGVQINIILDTNKNSFGKKKTGLPNIPMSEELIEDSKGKINIRWFAPMPEQFHTKMMYVKKKNSGVIISGSANYTSRNLNNFNLETNVKIKGPHSTRAIKETEQYFHKMWKNHGAEYTTSYKEHDEKTAGIKRGVYTLQKLLHLTTY
ncbi:phospholipase [Bacillus aerolatus]|uniref:phospholipase D n=1 Tax=Bacillus aerolatus TaxID=2653354 RepID=A0A6I1FPM6_9BACI|nr:phospholipase D family protein [Bacillus aerolatus]KAB7706240.1 phospholipase [Bacillus aerolatus]